MLYWVYLIQINFLSSGSFQQHFDSISSNNMECFISALLTL